MEDARIALQPLPGAVFRRDEVEVDQATEAVLKSQPRRLGAHTLIVNESENASLARIEDEAVDSAF